MGRYKIDLYEDAHGKSEIKRFLTALDNSHQKRDQVLLKKIAYQLSLLEQLGPELNEPQAKFIKGWQQPLMELRPMPERILYAAWAQNRFILLHHYTKRQNKTDRREIAKALKLLADWQARKEHKI